MSEKTFQLLGDGPYLEGDDPLEFHVLAEGIVGLLNQAHGSTPLTLGIQASWGMGKSSLMHQLKRKLDESPDTFKTVWFNAWTFDGEDILEGLIKTALEQMDPNILRRALRNEKFVNISKAITSIASRWIGINRLIDDLWEAVKVDPRARNQLRDLLNEAMEKWLHKNAKDQAKKKMIVIFIDDLDRCSPESVFSVFEAIKLYLDAKGFVFVIGVDSDIVSEAVLEHKKYSKRVTSEQYVEKIIQIAYNIPPATDKQIKKLFDRYSDRSKTTDLFTEEGKELVLERSSYNPRRIKRFINVFVMEQQLNPDTKGIKPELLIKIIMLGMYYRNFCRIFGMEEETDLITEFLEYEETRRTLIGIPKLEVSAVVEEFNHVFQRYQLEEPSKYGSGEAALKVLDDRVPEEFVRLAGQTAFVNLVSSIEEADRDAVKTHIKRVGVSVANESSETGTKVLNLNGLQILWIDDKPENNGSLIQQFEMGGAIVSQVTSAEEAIAELQKTLSPYNILISDVARGDNRMAGFEELDQIREAGNFMGRVIFFCGVIRKQDRDTARKLGADITNEPHVLNSLLSRYLLEGIPEAQAATKSQSPLFKKMVSPPQVLSEAQQLLEKMDPDEVIKELLMSGVGKSTAEWAVSEILKGQN